MKRYYKKNNYLRKSEIYFGLIFLAVLMIGGLLILFSGRFVSDPQSLQMWLLIIFPAIAVIYSIGKIFDVKSMLFSRGRYGENQVLRQLQKLPEDYFIFQGLTLDGKGDIDFTVVGPTGIFAIEAKSHKWPSPEQVQKFISQANYGAQRLHKYLQKNNQQNIWVKSVLVFANLKKHIDLGKIQEVDVVQNSYLNKIIMSYPQFMYQNKDSIIELLK